MKRCVACVPKSVCSFGAAAQSGRRWVSSDRSTLTHEALRERITGRIREDKYGDEVEIKPETKTVSTASGELPMSPLFDPNWIKARRRVKKEEPSIPSGRFRKKLAKNPFAKALATPMRQCPVTRIHIPRYFMQDYEAVKNPETGDAWWAPGPLAFAHVQRRPKETAEGVVTEETAPQADVVTDGDRFRRDSITAYSLSRKSIVDAMGSKKKRGGAGTLLAQRTGMAMSTALRNPVWRPDMGDVVLNMMRSQVTTSLVERAQDPDFMSMEPCGKWEGIKDVERRGCVLWLPENRETAATQYATYDIEDAKYGAKMAVHNLFWLLGDEHVAKLREASPMFRDNELVVLKTMQGKRMNRLHMLLWRMQGYLYKSGV